MKDDFFDPASLALEEEAEGESAPHRHQDEFIDPLLAIDTETYEPVSLLNEIEAAKLELGIELPTENSIAATAVVGVQEFFLAQVLAELTALILAPLSYRRYIATVLGILKRSFAAESISFIEYDAKAGDFFFRDAQGQVDLTRLAQVRIPEGHGILGQAATTQQSVMVMQNSSEPNFRAAIANIAGLEIRNGIAIPIVIQQRTFAVLEVFNLDGKFLESMSQVQADYLGSAIAKALEVRFLMARILKK